jgi:hypothetical protein
MKKKEHIMKNMGKVIEVGKPTQIKAGDIVYPFRLIAGCDTAAQNVILLVLLFLL